MTGWTGVFRGYTKGMLPNICIEEVDQNRMSCFSNDANVLAAERFPLISHDDRGVLLLVLSPPLEPPVDEEEEST